MKTIKRILTSALLIISCNISQAQDYKTGIGIRLGGYTSGITVKGFVNSNSAIEGIAGFGRYHFNLTGLYERHNPIQNAEGLKWLYGGGAHIGFYRYGYVGRYYYFTDHGHVEYVYATEPGATAAVGGLDFIIGLDYKFRNAPINIGLDLKPFVDFFDGVQGYWDGALSFRFVF